LAVLPWVRPGDHVVVARTVYGETRNLITQIAAGFGVHCSIAKSSDVAAFEDAISDSTRVVIVETPANPTLECVDIHAVAAIAHAKGARLVVDNTFATPINTQPAKLGADAVVHSATKYLAGHSDVLAGVLATDADGVARARDWLRITGPALGPFEAWLVVRGLRTLELRMARHNANGLAVAKLLESHKAVARVNYPGLTSHHSHAIAQKQMRAFGAMASVELVGGREMAKRFVENLSLFSPATSLGGVESLVQYPASLAKMSEDDQRASGISEHLIRLSVGCENPEDLLEDLSRSLERL
jgi:methionine-gamma-lyase